MYIHLFGHKPGVNIGDTGTQRGGSCVCTLVTVNMCKQHAYVCVYWLLSWNKMAFSEHVVSNVYIM